MEKFIKYKGRLYNLNTVCRIGPSASNDGVYLRYPMDDVNIPTTSIEEIESFMFFSSKPVLELRDDQKN